MAAQWTRRFLTAAARKSALDSRHGTTLKIVLLLEVRE